MKNTDSTSHSLNALLALTVLAAGPFLLVEFFGYSLYLVLDTPAYLTFHNVIEIFSVMVSLAIFGIGWFTFEQGRDRHALFLSIAFLGIGLMDFMHTLGHVGMPPLITANSANKSAQFWIAVRGFSALAFFLSGFVHADNRCRWLERVPLMLAAAATSVLTFLAVTLFPEQLPATFIDGVGLTPFKKTAEWAIIALLVLAVCVYARRLRTTGNRLHLYYLAAFILCIYSELLLTTYQSASGAYSVLGHLYKLVAFVLIYLGIFAAVVKRPYHELRLALAELAQTNNVLLHVMNSIPHSIFWKDRNCVYQGCNREFATRAGLAHPAQIVAKTDHDLPWRPEERDRYLADDREVMESGRAKMHIMESQHQGDGRMIWIDTSKIPLIDESGAVYGVLGVYEDVTSRKLADQQLSEMLQLNQEIITSAREGIIVYDRELRYVLWNPYMEELTGVPVGEVLGKRPEEVFPALTEVGLVARLERLFQGETPQTTEFRIPLERRGGTSFWVSDDSAPLRSASGEIIGVIGTVRDITGKRAIEEQLRQAQKLESVGRLAGGVAHDFNNKLTVILGNAELAALRNTDTRLQEYLKNITKAAEQSRDITAQLLAFSRQQVVSPRPLKVNDLLADLRKSLGRLIGEDICIVFLPGEGLWTVNIDPVQMDQIIMNLAVNARDAMPNGGTITIETGNVQLPKGVELHPDLPPGAYVRIVCRDSGAGMDAETCRHIFEPFYTTKERGKGTGLGLSTVYGIVRQNGGFIEVDTQLGRGTSFSVYLPGCHGEPLQEEAPAPAPQPGGRGTVMLVEDEDMVREMTCSMLESLGYRCLCVFGPQEGLEVAANLETEIDLVLTDVVMPGINGQDMMARIREMRPGIRGIYMSGFSQEIIDEGRAADEEMSFIKKPFTRDELALLLKRVREGSG